MGLLNRMIRAAMLDASLFEEVEADRGALGQAAIVVLLSSLAAGLGGAGIAGPRWQTQVLLTGIALVTWSAWAILVLQIGARVMPEPQTRADTGQLLRTLGFAATPGLLQVFAMHPPVSVAVFVVAWLWMGAAMVIAIRQALDYRGTWHAVAVTATAMALVVALVFTFGVLFGPTAS
jgi:hypothetical protein